MIRRGGHHGPVLGPHLTYPMNPMNHGLWNKEVITQIARELSRINFDPIVEKTVFLSLDSFNLHGIQTHRPLHQGASLAMCPLLHREVQPSHVPQGQALHSCSQPVTACDVNGKTVSLCFSSNKVWFWRFTWRPLPWLSSAHSNTLIEPFA